MASAPPRLRLDKSRPFSKVSGDRGPQNEYRLAHFQQDGIYFDAQGLHIDALIKKDKVRSLVDKRLKKMKPEPTKQPSSRDGEGDGKDANETKPDETDNNADGPVNLEAWLRGEAKYPFYMITKTVRERYSLNLIKQIDILEFLVIKEKVVPPSQLAPELKAILG